MSEPCFEHNDPDATLASLAGLGLSAATLACVPRSEWRPLQAELDRFYAYGYGGATQRTFLHSPHPRLKGQTPAEALRAGDQISHVCAALHSTLRTLHLS